MNTLSTPADLLYSEFIQKLKVAKESSETMILCAKEAVEIGRETMKTLRKMTMDHPFADPAEEIHFFKMIKPRFLAELIYYGKVYQLHARWPVGGKDSQKEYLYKNLLSGQQFFEENIEFCIYYRTNRTDLDDHYFLRNSMQSNSYTFIESYTINDSFSTGYDVLVAILLAFDRFAEYLQALLTFRDADTSETTLKAAGKKFTWTDDKIGLIELAHAFAERGSFNNGHFTLQEMISKFEMDYNVSLKYHYRYWLDIRNRKTDRPSFIEKLLNSFKKRLTKQATI